MTDGLDQASCHILAAAMDRILPRGPGPSATDVDAHVAVFNLVSQDDLATSRECLSRGAVLLDSLAEGLHQCRFTECDSNAQDLVLAHIQKVPHPSVRRFFTLLVQLTVTGFLGPPHYGGNRDEAGWEFVGFEPHPLTLAVGGRGPALQKPRHVQGSRSSRER